MLFWSPSVVCCRPLDINLAKVTKNRTETKTLLHCKFDFQNAYKARRAGHHLATSLLLLHRRYSNKLELKAKTTIYQQPNMQMDKMGVWKLYSALVVVQLCLHFSNRVLLAPKWSKITSYLPFGNWILLLYCYPSFCPGSSCFTN